MPPRIAKRRDGAFDHANGGCFWMDCTQAATHGLVIDGWRPIYCATHAAPFADALVEMAYPTCTYAGCGALAKFADASGTMPPKFCSTEHAGVPKGTVLRPAIQFCAACNSRVCCGPSDAPKACCVVCSKHGKVLGFGNVVSTKCVGRGGVPCSHGRGGGAAIAWWGEEGGPRLHCKECVDSDTETYQCLVPRCKECDKAASYALKTTNRKMDAVYCLACLTKAAERGVIARTDYHSVANFLCAECIKRGVPMPRAVHSRDVVCKSCAEDKEPSVRHPTKEGMRKGAVVTPHTASADAIAAAKAAETGILFGGGGYMCHADGCTKHAFYGKDNGARAWCVRHAAEATSRDGIPRVYLGARGCDAPGCTVKHASWGPSHHAYPTRCVAHKTDDMVNTTRQHVCASCGSNEFVRRKGAMCCDCRRATGVFKALEESVKCALTDCGMPPSSHDTRVPCAPRSGTRIRPDFVWRVDGGSSGGGDFYVVLEVDEDAHASYVLECEIGRLHQLAESFDGAPLFVVRYNPNAYITRDAAFAIAANHARRREATHAHAALVALLRRTFTRRDMPEFGIHVEYMGYPRAHIDKLEGVQTSIYEPAADDDDAPAADDDAPAGGAGSDAKRVRVEE